MREPISPDTAAPQTVEQLEEILSRPPDSVVEVLARCPGDVAFLGVGGKMGPTMARMAHRAFQAAGVRRRVIGVSRFRDQEVRTRLERWGIETIECDLLDPGQVARLPDVPNIISMSGFKFGASENPELAWAANCYLPALVCQRYRHSRIVAFSTGNVYGMVARTSGGSVETDLPQPDGEYAMTALGRERMYQYFSQTQGTPIIVLRLNYATELRYGVLVDLARQIYQGLPVDVSMGYVNVIWLGDANAMTLAALEHVDTPARILNLAGPDILSTREVCTRLGDLMSRPARIVGNERDDALLSNGSRGYQLLGPPQCPSEQMIRWTAEWVGQQRPTLDRPTHFQTRTGKF